MLIIDEAADWARVNEPALRVFCVLPGDYSKAGSLSLTASGTAARPRVLRYYDPDAARPEHPVQMSPAKRAVVTSLRIAGGDHWVVHGLTVQGSPRNHTTLLNASHNLLDRMLIQDGAYNLLEVRGVSNDNVLQNSVLRRAPIAWGGDRVCLLMVHPGIGHRQERNRVVGNEIYDCTDGIQLYLPGAASRGGHFSGLVIEDNDIYLSPSRYTNCRGARDPKGDCACGENGIDVKIGGESDAPDRSVVIARNRIWGWRESDHGLDGGKTLRCGASGSWGDAVSLHAQTSHVALRDNIVFDGPRGVAVAQGVHDVAIEGNLFYGLGRSGKNRFAIGLAGGQNQVVGNTIVDSGRWLAVHQADMRQTTIRCNTVVGSQGRSGRPLGPGSAATQNAYFGTPARGPAQLGDIVAADARAAHAQDRCFWRKRWTDPEWICLPGAARSPQTPLPVSCEAGSQS